MRPLRRSRFATCCMSPDSRSVGTVTDPAAGAPPATVAWKPSSSLAFPARSNERTVALGRRRVQHEHAGAGGGQAARQRGEARGVLRVGLEAQRAHGAARRRPERRGEHRLDRRRRVAVGLVQLAHLHPNVGADVEEEGGAVGAVDQRVDVADRLVVRVAPRTHRPHTTPRCDGRMKIRCRPRCRPSPARTGPHVPEKARKHTTRSPEDAPVRRSHGRWQRGR